MENKEIKIESSMVERFEKVSKIISKHVDSEIARANNSKKLQVKDGGRHLCEAIVVKQILAITQSEINLAVAKYQTDFEQKHIASAVELEREKCTCNRFTHVINNIKETNYCEYKCPYHGVQKFNLIRNK